MVTVREDVSVNSCFTRHFIFAEGKQLNELELCEAPVKVAVFQLIFLLILLLDRLLQPIAELALGWLSED